MFCKTKKLFISVFTTLAFLTLYNIYSGIDVFAHTASINTSGTINLDVSASGNGANIVKDEITINSSCPLGYTVSISGPADSTLYKDGNKTNNSASQKITASSGTVTAPASIMSNRNTWGYTTSAVNGGADVTINSNFIGLTNTASILTTSSAGSVSGGDKFDVFYGVSVDASLEAGQYKLAETSTGANDNIITYFLTTNPACDTYAIRYNDNGANSSSKMGNQTVDTTTDLTLWASNFKNPNNKGFAGWNTKADGTGKSYGPNETIPQSDLNSFLETNAIVDNGAQYVDLYAIWVDSVGDLQSWTGCSAMNVGDVTALKDARDNNTYAVAKLADGKCWMIENLRLDNTATLTIANTNNPLNNGTNVTLKNTDGTTTNHLSISTNPATTAWCTATSVACMDQAMLYTGNTTDPVANVSQDIDQNTYSYGNYYNWYSVTAGRGTYSKTSGNAEGDICPAGWHLPAGNTSSDFSVLDTAMGGTGSTQTNNKAASRRWRNYPNNFIYSGYARNTLVTNRSSQGGYWSSTAGSSGYAYFLYLYSDYVYPGTYYGGTTKNVGFMARCIANETYTITYNSNGGSGDMASQTVNAGETINLYSNAFTAPANKRFYGWNTEADGTGTDYTNEQSVADLIASGQTVTLYAQWSKAPVNGYIVYDGNNNTSSFGMDNQQAAGTVTLWASNYARDGYGFAGWSTEKLNPDDPDFQTKLASAVSQNKVYGPNERVTIAYTGWGSNIEYEDKVLYAVWVKSAGDLQDWTCPDNTTMPIGSVTALTDQRDNNTYAVAKLGDGKCWMIENLRLDNEYTVGAENEAKAQGYAKSTTYGDFIGLAEPETADFANSSIANSIYYSGTQSGSASINIGTTTPGSRFPRYNNQSTASPVANMASSAETYVYSQGNYYTWAAAVANTGEYGNGINVTTTSICPKGWHLPTGRFNNSDYNLLDAAIRGTNNGYRTGEYLYRQYPNNFIYSGSFDNASPNVRGAEGSYWSSTTADNGRSAAFVITNEDYIWAGNTSLYKYIGASVRCRADD